VPVEKPSTASEADFKKKAGDLMAYSMRRRRLMAAALVAAIGFAAGIGYRFFIDNADERELANYLRSGVHGVGIALAGWTVQNTLGPNARSSLGSALRRLPLLRELIVRSLLMTLVIVIVGVALQFALYAEPYGLHWFKLEWFTGTLPWIIALGIVISFVIGAFTEAGRMIGAPMLANIALGTYHRPKREQTDLGHCSNHISHRQSKAITAIKSTYLI
jgi:hypothetical protein